VGVRVSMSFRMITNRGFIVLKTVAAIIIHKNKAKIVTTTGGGIDCPRGRKVCREVADFKEGMGKAAR